MRQGYETAFPMLAWRLTLEERRDAPDGGGGGSENWTALGEIWAELRPLSGRERVTGAAQVSRVTHKIVLRAAQDGAAHRPRADQRFRGGERIFAIRAVAETDGRGRYLVCWAEEGGAP